MTDKLKGLTLAKRVSQIQSEVTKPGPGHSKSDQAAHITQWLQNKPETGHGFPAAGGSKEKHVAGKIPPQFLKNVKKKGVNPFAAADEKSDPKAAMKKKKAGRASAVAKRLGGKSKKGSLPPWLEKK